MWFSTILLHNILFYLLQRFSAHRAQHNFRNAPSIECCINFHWLILISFPRNAPLGKRHVNCSCSHCSGSTNILLWVYAGECTSAVLAVHLLNTNLMLLRCCQILCSPRATTTARARATASVAASSYKSRRAAAQIKMCRYELINTQFKTFFSQRIKKQTRCERFARTAAAAGEFYLALFWLFSSVLFNVLFRSWVSACCQLRCGTWIYFGCAQFLRISLDIETFERVLCNYSISWRCKQPNSSAYLALIADGSDLKLILHIHISFIWAHWTAAPSAPRCQRMHFQNQSQVKDATAAETKDG